ncbi:hypothetical protein TNCV_145471 [Trichonephila clavipes]|nr:hypothetical protein TNCV_145471 [Trichonephila clavipes]
MLPDLHYKTGCRKPQYGREQPAKFFTARIEEMIQNDRWVNLSEISSELGLSYDSVQHIVSDVLRYSKNIAVKSSAENWLNGQGPDLYRDGLNK